MRTLLKHKISPAKQIQRKPFFAKDEGENFMSSSKGNGFFSSDKVQTSLLAGNHGDSHETEADNVASDVVNRIENNNTETKTNHNTTSGKIIQRQPLDENYDDTGTTVESPTGVGSAMDVETQSSMEEGFGADFSGVKIHTGTEATAMNQSLNSRAFTTGSDIYFNTGQYNTGTTEGKHLIAHELTHTIQQGASPVVKPKEKNEKNEETGTSEEKNNRSEATKEKQKQIPENIDSSVSGSIGDVIQKGKKDKASAPDKEKKESSGKAKKEPVKGKGKKKKKLSLSTFLGSTKKEKSAGGGGGGGGAGGGAARVTEMVKPSLDGGPEKMEAKTEAGKGSAEKELNVKSENVYQKGIQKSKALSTAEKEKEDTGTKLRNVEAAVEIKPEEKKSEVNNKQIKKVDAVKEPEVKDDKAKKELKDKIEESMPDTLKEAMKYASNGKGRKIGQAVGNVVEGDVRSVESTYKEVENTETPAPPPASEPLNDIEPVKETPAMDLGKGLVPPTSKKQTDLEEYDQESDKLLEKEGLPEEQLEMVDSGDLAEAKKHRKDLKKNKTAEPAKIKAFEQHKRIETKVGLQREEKKTKTEMRAKRTKELQGSKNEQKKAKSDLEKKREEVTRKINGIYETANKSVKAKLKNLKKDSLAAFDKEEQKSSKEFESNVKRRLNAFKRRRYGGRWGGAKWLKDKILGMKDLPEVKKIFDTEKKAFEGKIDAAIKTITKANKKVIQECKNIIAKAKKDIAGYVKGLGPALKKTGLEAQKKMKEKLDKLDKDVNAAEKELNKKLQQKREAAIKAIEKKIEKMKEAMGGLLAKLGNLLLDALLKFFKWALKKAGYNSDKLMGTVNKGKSVISKIVKDPKGFFRNLGTAVGNGIRNFVKNIKSWLIKGLISWLTGALGDSGLVLPEKFDLKGIFGLALQVMGLTWTFVRSRLVKYVPEKVVAVAEKSVDIIKRVIKEGPIAIWHIIKEKAAEVKTRIMEGIRNWIVWQIVKKATFKLLSMLNPVGAIVQAILTIYDVVMFFVNNWDRIVEFVKSVVDSIGDIAMGNLGKAAKMVENALGMTIPIILNFLARFIGLSGIGKAISNVISKIRAPIVKVIDKIAMFLGRQINKLIGKGKAIAKGAVNAVASWWRIRKRIKTKNKESHTIYFKGTGKGAKLMMASSPQSYVGYLTGLKKEHNLTGDAVDKAMLKAKEIDKEIKLNVPASEEKSHGIKINGMIDELATLTMNLPIPDTGGKNTNPVFGPLRQGFGTFARVDAIAGGHAKGTKANSGLFNTQYEFLNKRLHSGGAARYYIRGHLLNNNLGGTGDEWKNLTPLKGAVNGEHSRNFEEKVKGVVNSGGQVKNFRVRAIYGRSEHPVVQNLINGTQDYPELEDKDFTARELGEVIRAEQYVPVRLDCWATGINKNSDKEAPAAGSNPVSIIQSNAVLEYGNLSAYRLGGISRRSRYNLKLVYVNSNGNMAAFVNEITTNLGLDKDKAEALFKHLQKAGSISGHQYRQVLGITKSSIENNNPDKKIIGKL